jgi:hypothetical protein
MHNMNGTATAIVLGLLVGSGEIIDTCPET